MTARNQTRGSTTTYLQQSVRRVPSVLATFDRTELPNSMLTNSYRMNCPGFGAAPNYLDRWSRRASPHLRNSRRF